MHQKVTRRPETSRLDTNQTSTSQTSKAVWIWAKKKVAVSDYLSFYPTTL
jgi:hypothetical protein